MMCDVDCHQALAVKADSIFSVTRDCSTAVEDVHPSDAE